MDFCVLSLCPTPPSLRSWWCLFPGWSRSLFRCLESDLAEWNQQRFGKIVCLFAQIFLPNLKAKGLNIFISTHSVVTSPLCWPSAWWGANLWMSFYSLTWKLEREASAWSSGSSIYCLDFLTVRVLSQFCLILEMGLEWFSGFLMTLCWMISLKDTTSVCLELVPNEHIFVFQSGFQILIFLFIAIYFTTIQMPWKSKDSDTHSAVILFCRLVWFAPTFLMKSLGSPVHTVLSAQPQITRFFQFQWQIGTIGKTTLLMTP